MPRVTIGVPVYNGAALIRECLENLASQRLDDFDVLISDNASTDGTSEICAEFAARDIRFRHHRHAVTSSANDNFRWVRDAADSEFFAYRAYDDLSSTDYVAGLLAVLAERPSTWLAVGTVRQHFGSPGRDRLRPWPFGDTHEQLPPAQRIPAQMSGSVSAWFYGLWRRDALTLAFERVLSEYRDLWAGDHLILLRAMLADGLRGTSDPAVEFIQRVLPGPRHYIAAKRPGWTEMRDRNARFQACARAMLAESGADAETRQAVERALPHYTLQHCHGRRRLFHAGVKKLLGRGA